MTRERSEAAFQRAQKVIPGGVNSPVRAFHGVGGTPPFIARGEGARLYDIDGNEYIDYVCSWGPLLLGHCHPAIMDAVRAALEDGASFGAPTEREVEMAEAIRDAVPSMEMVRLVNSGTEATMSAIRVARGFTGRDLTVKFEGCYHGHVDSLLVKAGSGLATLGIADTPGVPQSFVDTTLALPFNCVDAVEAAFRAHGDRIASVIVEPVVGNMGCVPPQPGFLEALREITARHGALLIFDEVMTGFRVAFGGAQQRYGIRPDMTTLGKVIGGGLPIGAYGGRADIMGRVAPAGPIYQAGTLSGNPLAVAAGLAMLRHLKAHPEIYDDLESKSAAIAEAAPEGVTVNRVGSMFTWFFADEPVTDYDSAKRSDISWFSGFHRRMLEQGIYLPPSQFEAAFISAAHSVEDIRKTIAAAREASHDSRMLGSRAMKAFFEGVNAGAPIPVVDPADLRHHWDFIKEIQAKHPPSEAGPIGIDIRVLEAELGPGKDIHAISFRGMMLSLFASQGLLTEWQHGPELEDVVFQVAAMFPFHGIQVDSEAFLEQLRKPHS